MNIAAAVVARVSWAVSAGAVAQSLDLPICDCESTSDERIKFYPLLKRRGGPELLRLRRLGVSQRASELREQPRSAQLKCVRGEPVVRREGRWHKNHSSNRLQQRKAAQWTRGCV